MRANRSRLIAERASRNAVNNAVSKYIYSNGLRSAIKANISPLDFALTQPDKKDSFQGLGDFNRNASPRQKKEWVESFPDQELQSTRLEIEALYRDLLAVNHRINTVFGMLRSLEKDQASNLNITLAKEWLADGASAILKGVTDLLKVKAQSIRQLTDIEETLQFTSEWLSDDSSLENWIESSGLGNAYEKYKEENG